MGKLKEFLRRWHYALPYGYRWIADLVPRFVVGILLFLLLQLIFRGV